jgi:hypothetical protein
VCHSDAEKELKSPSMFEPNTRDAISTEANDLLASVGAARPRPELTMLVLSSSTGYYLAGPQNDSWDWDTGRQTGSPLLDSRTIHRNEESGEGSCTERYSLA